MRVYDKITGKIDNVATRELTTHQKKERARSHTRYYKKVRPC